MTSLGDRLSEFFRPRLVSWLVCAVVIALWLWTYGPDVQDPPWIDGDSQYYIDFANFRPPIYPLFLALHTGIFGSLDALPLTHAVMFFACCLFLAALVAIRIQNILVFPLIFLVSANVPEIHLDGVMSEPLFASLMALGFGFYIVHRMRGGLVWLILTSIILALAMATRTIGAVPLAIVIVLEIMLFEGAFHARLRHALAAIVPAVMVLVSAAGINAHVNGRFEIGSYGGASVFGKGLTVADPLPPSSELQFANAIVPIAQRTRNALDAAPSLHLRVLMQRQYYSFLRWYVFEDEVAPMWPDWPEDDIRKQGELAGELSKEFILRNPNDYLMLAAGDYVSLWLLPRVMTPTEHARLTKQFDEVKDVVPFTDPVFATDPFYQVVPPASDAVYPWFVRLIGVSVMLSSLAALLCLRSLQALRRHADLAVIILTIHASFLATAAVESGLPRYTSVYWPLMAASLFWSIGYLFSHRRKGSAAHA